ncbi:MAG: hypothetical protein QOJ84_751, partial [Bradyrhizobium sp.]|nr:hypothetical protein [Bradyrhizobium sp.]
MLEITGNDIALLSDEDLRSLVGRLCESELRSRGLSTSAVTWGGNQNAADGGIDVRVRIKDGTPPGGFVPRVSIGFQVKKTDFTPGLITPEMRPLGQLRASISDLIDERGAYIIASSGSDTSDSAWTDRLNAMRSAVADKTGHAEVHLDFYDRNRLATWTRSHPGLVVWIRQKVGRGISGWQPYSSWAVSPDGVQDEYLLDDKARLHIGITDEKGIDIAQGIERLRDTLRGVRGVVRLVGLSGVGKTRLVQALFDARVGNARVALALANTLERHESVAGLQDEELFKRLFHQRQDHDDNLLKAAQACALLYSFQGEALSGDEAELPKIAVLVGMNAQLLFAKVAQLKERDLVQRRSVWRAILPHAIANRLAKMALREIPTELIEHQFNTERLMKSFSRRLGYLHESDEAKRVAEKWLAKDGLLADVGRLNEFGLAMFNNIAPVSPEATLAAIETALSGPNASGLITEQLRRNRFGTILHSIAYDASLFDRCGAAMIPFALAEPSDDRTHPIGGALEGLCHIYLSGTHATIEQRVRVVDGCLCSNEPKNRSLGLQLLDALLQADHFSGTHSFQFGVWVRDYGYWPNTREEIAHWFVSTLQLARRFASKNDETASVVRSKIADSIRSIWFLGSEVQEQFEAIAGEIVAKNYWQEGWIAARSVLSRPPDGADVAAVQRLRNFECRLRPKNIAEQVRAVVLTRSWGAFDYAEMDDDGEIEPEKPMARYEKANAAAEELGKIIYSDEAVFEALLPDLVGGDAGRLVPFGKGLALVSADRRRIWDQLTQALAGTEETKRNAGVLIGFLSGLFTVDQRLCEVLLEEAVAHETLGAWFPILQTSVTISKAGANRLKRSVTLGKARVRTFESLGWGRSSEAISGEDLRTIILSLAKQENGYGIATDILWMRFGSNADQKKEYPLELVDAGRALLSSPIFDVRNHMHDYHMCAIANVCLRGAEGSAAAQSLCEQIKQGFADYTFRAYNHEQLLHCIFKLQPRIALDVFFGGTPQVDDSDIGVDDFDSPSDRRKNPLDGVPIDEMLRWCDEKPAERYPAISRAASYHTAPKEGVTEWTPLAMEMLRRAPDPLAILETFVKRFSPRSWSGSRAAIIESRLVLLVIWNASSSHYMIARISCIEESACGECRCERPADRAASAECA